MSQVPLSQVQVSRGRSRGLAIGLTVLLLIFVVAPIGYAYAAYNALGQLKTRDVTIEVERDGWNIYVRISVIVENPTSIPLPTLNVLSECELNEHSLFYSEQSQIGSLNPHSTATLRFATVVNFDLFSDLFWTLVDYLAGKPISYHFCFAITLHLLVDFPVFEIKRQGVWELY